MNERRFYRALEKMPIIPALKREIVRQESKWGSPTAPKKSLAGRLPDVEKHLQKAQEAAIAGDHAKAVEELQFLTALALSMLISHTTKQTD